MQTMDELIPITAIIGDRSYRIKIQPRDEEVVRRTLKVVNDKIIEFKTLFAGKDMQDYIAMVLVWYATEQNASLANELNEDNISAKLSLIEKMLDSQAAHK
jgi:Cell division protein ZapA